MIRSWLGPEFVYYVSRSHFITVKQILTQENSSFKLHFPRKNDKKRPKILSLSLAKVCRPNSSFAFDFLQHHVHIRHTRDYDKQKVVVVVQASLIRETHEYANVANASQRLR